MERQYFVYNLTNRHHTVLYTGVTNDLIRRVYEHREKLTPGFTCRNNVTELVFYECFSDVHASLAREKQIKAGSRASKIALIEGMNPEWQDLYRQLLSRQGAAPLTRRGARTVSSGGAFQPPILPPSEEIAASLRSSQ